MTRWPRVLVVTGGSRGIGAQVAAQAAAAGWAVVLSYVEEEHRADAVVAAIRRDGGAAWAVRADIAEEDDVLALFRAAGRVGTVRGVVANAAVVAPPLRLRDVTAERVRRVLDVNVLGTILCCREAVRTMSTVNGHEGGALVLVSSAASRIGAAGEYVDYAASKAAVDALTVGLANEVAGEGIRVLGVRPGLIETEIHEPGRLDRIGTSPPLGRPGRAEEVAAVIAFLASDRSSYMTGSSVDVAGGR